MAAAQPPWPPPGSPQYAGVRDAWRDATLAEWFLHHPQGKALFRIWAAMQRARWQSPPSGAGAAGGAPRTAPAGAPPRPAPPARSGARAPDAARAGPSAPSPSEAQRRRQRRERARAAAVAAAAAGQAGGGTAASDPAAAVRGAASAGGGPEPARPSSAHAPTQATAATTQAAAAGDELRLVCPCGPDAPLRDMVMADLDAGGLAPEEAEYLLAVAAAEEAAAEEVVAPAAGAAGEAEPPPAPALAGARDGGEGGGGAGSGSGAALGMVALAARCATPDVGGCGQVGRTGGAHARSWEDELGAFFAAAKAAEVAAGGEAASSGAAAPAAASAAVDAAGGGGRWADAVEPSCVVRGALVLAERPEGWRPAGPAGVAERHAGRRRDPAERPPSEASAEAERSVDARGCGGSSRRASKRREVRGATADAGGS